MENRVTYFPGLNGLRAIAALCILFGHIQQKDFVCWDVYQIPTTSLWVYMFFVISGFLAGVFSDRTYSLSSYYKKKVKRILPAYYICVFTVIAAMMASHNSDIISGKLLYYIFLLPNIPFSSSNGIVPLVHLWFVGTIIMFYLIFPFVVIIQRKSRVNEFLLPSIIAIAWICLKFILYLSVGKDTFAYRFIASNSFDCIFAGVLAGISYKNGGISIKKIHNNSFLGILAWAAVIFAGFYETLIPAPIRPEIMSIFFLIIILNQIRERAIINLENIFFKKLGEISYETYIVQIPVIMLLSLAYAKLSIKMSGIAIYTICTATVLLISFALFHIIRKSFSRV